MTRKRILHVYGDVKILGDYCPQCKQHAFIMDSKFSCCGFPDAGGPVELIKQEIDLTGMKRHQLPRWKKNVILSSQRNRCFYCGYQFGSYRMYKNRLRLVVPQFDHVIPFELTCLDGDFVAACRECNAHKSNKVFDTFKQAQDYLQQFYVY